MEQFERYWLFAVFCLGVGLVTLRLILRERLTLQGSLSLLGFLCVMSGVALFPDLTSRLAHRLGFTLPSNFFFALSIAILALLYLQSQVTLSRIELRTIALTQEVGLLREQLDRQSPKSDEESGEEFAEEADAAALHVEKPAPLKTARRAG